MYFHVYQYRLATLEHQTRFNTILYLQIQYANHEHSWQESKVLSAICIPQQVGIGSAQTSMLYERYY